MTQGTAETRTLDTKRSRQTVQRTSTIAARFVWNMYVCMYESLLVDLWFRSPIGVTAALPLLNIKLASCLKLRTKKISGLRKQEATLQRKLLNEELHQTMKWAEALAIRGEYKKCLENLKE